MPEEVKINFEFILKEPFKLSLGIQSYQFDILRIRSAAVQSYDKDGGGPFENKDLLKKANIIEVTPQSIFVSQHPDWIDLNNCPILLRRLYIPINNIAGVIDLSGT